MVRRLTPHLVAVAGVIAVVVGTFLAWTGTGGARRSSYDLFAIVDRLGFAVDGLVAWGLRIWPLGPLSGVLVVVLVGADAVTGRLRLLAGAAAIVFALVCGGAAVTVRAAPGVGRLTIGPGVTVTLIGAAVTLVAGVLLLAGGEFATARRRG